MEKRKKRRWLVAGGVLGILVAALYFSVQLPQPEFKLEALRGQVRRHLEISPEIEHASGRQLIALYTWGEDHVAVRNRVEREALAKGFRADFTNTKERQWSWTNGDLVVWVQANQLANVAFNKLLDPPNRTGVSVILSEPLPEGTWLRWRDIACDLVCRQDD